MYMYIYEIFMLQCEKKIYIISTLIVFLIFPLVLLSKITKFHFDLIMFRGCSKPSKFLLYSTIIIVCFEILKHV